MSQLTFQHMILNVTVLSATMLSGIADERTDLFESVIRPILVEQCSACHGDKKQSGELRVDSLKALLRGGDTGPAIVPGQSHRSLLMQAVVRSEDLAMPPDKPLTKPQIDALQKWIDSGAVWPKSTAQLESMTDRSAKTHWAFQPVHKPEVPHHKDAWGTTPIDAFILRALKANSLSHAPQADRRTLLRRASYAVTGLPPSPEAVAAFASDQRPDSWQQAVDNLLNSQRYGEHQARHWLDVARYADTKGYVYGREERFWVHAWTYRDWIINAFNSDMPYDRFLLLQLAADQVEDRAEGDLAAMGFLTLGRRFLGLKHDIIDDRIDVVCRGTMGLTVSCARCHDHKYDPIPTADYYSLYGVFDSCAEELVPLSHEPVADKAFADELAKRVKTLVNTRQKRCEETSTRIRNRVGDYLLAQTELHKYPPAGFDQIIAADDLHPRIVSRWQTWLYNAKRRKDPVFRAWHEFAQIPAETFSANSASVARELSELNDGQLNPLVAAAFATAPGSFLEVVDRYAALLSTVDADWKALTQSAVGRQRPLPRSLENAAEEQLRQVIYGVGSPCVIAEEHIANTETLFSSGNVNELWKQQGEVDRWIIQAKYDVPYAMTLIDRAAPSEPRIFRRGNPASPGAPVSRRFLSLFSPDSETPFTIGSGRRELADAIIDPNNPLTARVMVNRVWTHIFGEGLVTTASDFGLRAERPSHPELLDWLTSWFMENDWSLKKLHRLLLTSAVFQQTARGLDPNAVQAAQQIDPDNRLLWHMTPRRLTFEESRDSLLQAAEDLQTEMGGKSFDLFSKGSQVPRRTVYGTIDRQFLPGTLRMFDFANPDLHIARRSETTVPQQALFFMNHEMVLEQVRVLAAKSAKKDDSTARMTHLFQRILQRAPTSAELQDAMQLVTSTEETTNERESPTVADWSYGYGEVNESDHQIVDFKPVPHFTGTAWQGGNKWPDAKLGWVNLTATGGHPGNTRKHACVRRWTAPRDMTVRITSRLTHEPAAGDGIRVFVLASEHRGLHSVKAHQQTVDLNTDAVSVKTGDAVDFVVDIDKVLNNDQFLWQISIADINETATGHSHWNSQTDFARNTVQKLSAWEQLAHLLLCTNEFMFVD
ncbi:MAG: PSD1 and planctomycete cytochrome C domain-containing protein [Fuerstiella sp.]|nr:PSD1 and planctomycete cytochrome C domain-containing protein [Fuerstiella sp.]